MTIRTLLRVTALAEGGTALALLVVPSLPSDLLFGRALQTPLEGILGRVVGAALISLSTACWWASDYESSMASILVRTMLLYDVLVIALLVYAGLGLGLSGIALWPAVVAHVFLGAWSAAGLEARRPYIAL